MAAVLLRQKNHAEHDDYRGDNDASDHNRPNLSGAIQGRNGVGGKMAMFENGACPCSTFRSDPLFPR